MDMGLLILRLGVGLVLTAHGSQKAFGWFGGGGLKGTTAMTARMGFRPAPLWAAMVAAGELGGGVLLALGLLNPIGPLGIAAPMAVAVITLYRAPGFWARKGGYEFPLVLLMVALAVAFAGSGRYSLDVVLGIAIPRNLGALLAALTVLAVAVGLASRQMRPAPQVSSAPA